MGDQSRRPRPGIEVVSPELLQPEPTSRGPSGQANLHPDFALIGAVASVLDPARCLPSLDAALELIADGLMADLAEIFMLDPEANELLLVSHCGEPKEVFAKRCRFAVGVGFPGIAVQTGQPKWSTDLAHDEEFIRRAFKTRGYQTFISIPFAATNRILGTLDLGWRRGQVDVEHAARVAAMLGRPLGNTILAASVVEAREWSRQEADIRERFQGACDADEVVLVRIGESDGWPGPTRSAKPGYEARAECSRVAHRGMVMHDDPTRMPTSCLTSCGVAEARYCVPLREDGELQWVARLSYSGEAPSPPTRHAIAALMVAESAAHPVRPPSLPSVEIEARTPELELRCFGGFEVLVDGEPLPRSAFSRKKAIELLQLLALQTGRSLPTRRLTRLLWPGVDADAARNRLHGVVHALRKAIQPKPRPGPQRNFVESKDDLYSLGASTAIRVDLWEFRRLLATARNASLAGDRSSGVADALRRAVEIYRSDLFADLPDTLWTIDPRSRCRELCVNALLQLAQMHGELGTPDEAIRLLRQAVQVDPLREDVHLRLMRTLLAEGRRRDALHQYEVLCTELDQELDAAPSELARTLLAEIHDTMTVGRGFTDEVEG